MVVRTSLQELPALAIQQDMSIRSMCPLPRCPLKTLQKCEIALEKLKNDMAVVSGAQGSEVSALKEPDFIWKFYPRSKEGRSHSQSPILPSTPCVC